MDVATLAVGILAIGIGLFFLSRSLRPGLAEGKLKAMMGLWGDSRGLWLYRFSYVGIPFALGVTLLVAGANGLSLGELF